MLAVTGDPPEEGDYAGSHAVYDVDAIRLTQIVERMNRGEDYHGRAIDAPTSFSSAWRSARPPTTSTSRSSASGARSTQARSTR